MNSALWIEFAGISRLGEENIAYVKPGVRAAELTDESANAASFQAWTKVPANS
jgi:hypothetical protein